MILGSSYIYKYILEEKTKCLDKDGKIILKPLIEGLPEGSVIEGCSPDLRLGEIAEFKRVENAEDIPYLFIEKRMTAKFKELDEGGVKKQRTKKSGIVRLISDNAVPWIRDYYIDDAQKRNIEVMGSSVMVFTKEAVNMGMIDINLNAKINLQNSTIQILSNKKDAGNINIQNTFLWGEVKPRGTLVRSGVELKTFTVNPNYQGTLGFLMYLVSPNCFDIEIGSPFCNISFHIVIGDVLYPYGTKGRGYWQGGSTEKYGKVAPPH